MGLHVAVTIDPDTPASRTVLDLADGTDLPAFWVSGWALVRRGPSADGSVPAGITRITLDGVGTNPPSPNPPPGAP